MSTRRHHFFYTAAHLHLQIENFILAARSLIRGKIYVCPEPNDMQAHLAQLSLGDIFKALETHQDQADLQAKGLVALGVLGQVRGCASTMLIGPSCYFQWQALSVH